LLIILDPRFFAANKEAFVGDVKFDLYSSKIYGWDVIGTILPGVRNRVDGLIKTVAGLS